MFTGLIQQTGEIAALERAGTQTRITVRAKNIAKELKTGDSVAVSGVCLTALDIGEEQFSADLAQETVERTSLRQLKPGALVNLELPASQERVLADALRAALPGAPLAVSHEVAPIWREYERGNTAIVD